MRSAEPFDFDRIDLWAPALRTELDDLIPADLGAIIAATVPEFVEDACHEMLKMVNRDAIAARVSFWIEAQPLAAYHGSRMSSEEIAAVQMDGLKPLVGGSRIDRLRRMLSPHPRWPQVASQLEGAIRKFAGDRDGRVYLTVSLAGLMRRFNHYLTRGSEFDYHVAHDLLGEEGRAIVAGYGVATVFKLFVPGKIALAACNPFGPRATDLPSPVFDILCVWSYWLARPGYRSESRELDCTMMFRETVPASWIESVILVDDAELGAHGILDALG